MNLLIMGSASQKILYQIKISELNEDDLQNNVLAFLQKIPLSIASSCKGVGFCQKCMINETIISCQLTLQDFILRHKNTDVMISIAYL